VNAMGIDDFEKDEVIYNYNDEDDNFYLIGSG
jgi:hypothetical protein